MAHYIVVYDLRKPGKDYTELINALRSLPHFHAQQSVWFVRWSQGAVELRDKLRQHIDTNDMLFVAQFGDWATINMRDAANWLKP